MKSGIIIVMYIQYYFLINLQRFRNKEWLNGNWELLYVCRNRKCFKTNQELLYKYLHSSLCFKSML
jgi:hypothetical protein